MEDTIGLRRVLSALSDAYLLDDNHAGVDDVEVRLDDGTPRADTEGNWVAVNPDVRDTYGRDVDPETELRIIADTLAHEVEHVNQSDLGSKADIAEANPDMPQAAGMIANVLEDLYIDTQRMARNPGMRVSHKKKIDALMGNHHRRPKLDTLLDKKGMVAALIECALQVTATYTSDEGNGWAKGLEEFDPDHNLVRFAVRWNHIMGEVEDAHGVDDRLDAIQGAVDLLRQHAPDDTTGRDMDEAADDRGGDNLFDDDEAPDLDDLDMDPDDLDRDADVSEREGQPAPTDDDPDMDDLDPETADDGDGDDWDDDLDDLDDLDPDDWGDDADGGDDPFGDPDDDMGTEDGDLNDPEGPDGRGGSEEPDADEPSPDGPDGTGADGDGDGGDDPMDPETGDDAADGGGDLDGSDTPDGDGDADTADADGPAGDDGLEPDPDGDETIRVDDYLDKYDPADLEVDS